MAAVLREDLVRWAECSVCRKFHHKFGRLVCCPCCRMQVHDECRQTFPRSVLDDHVKERYSDDMLTAYEEMIAAISEESGICGWCCDTKKA